jgi:hypothetical protein
MKKERRQLKELLSTNYLQHLEDAPDGKLESGIEASDSAVVMYLLGGPQSKLGVNDHQSIRGYEVNGRTALSFAAEDHLELCSLAS